MKMTPCPKPEPRGRKPRKRLNKIGPVGRRRLAANKARRPLAEVITWCELRGVLKSKGISHSRCDGEELTWAHSVKHRGNDPVLEAECCRGCPRHHYFVTDLLSHEQQKEIVCEAIRRRQYEMS
jgi:hypothetical protein